MSVDWLTETPPQRYDGPDMVTCPKGHEFMAFEAKYTEDHAATREMPAEGHFSCPTCGAEMER